MIVAAITVALAAQGSITLEKRAVVDLAGPAIHLRDVVPALAARQEGGLEIARLPAGRRTVTLSRMAIAALVRRAAPGLVIRDVQPGAVTFRLATSTAGRAPRCFVTLAPAAAGAVIGRSDVERGACGAGLASVRYDPSRHAVVATRTLAAGESIGRALPPPASDIGRGDTLTLVARSGPVTIERSVTAMQPGRNGGRVFVRDEAGQVFAAPVAGAAR